MKIFGRYLISGALIIGVFFFAGAHAETSDHMDMGDSHSGAHDHEKIVQETMQQMDDETAGEEKVGVEERLGESVALDAVFTDSTGRKVTLRQIFDKPVVLLPIYFMCPSVCNTLQADLADALNSVGQVPGEEFNIISLSFSDDETYDYARTSKQNYANLLKRNINLNNWYYLTGDMENIRKVTDSLGYYFIKKEPNVYVHPSALVVLAQNGMIARYLYGPDFLPFDLGMAVSEAQKGEVGLSIKRGVLSFCFDYDPENKTYVFKMFRITGTAVLITLLGFILFLNFPGKKKCKKFPPEK